MKIFKVLVLSFILILFVACENSDTNNNTLEDKKEHICPQCNMPFSVDKDSSYFKKIKFDDIGCMVLWAKEKNIDFNKVETQVYLNDKNKYINSKKAYYKINGKTPMNYGFVAYENNCDECITFDEVILRMLRGEHLANPKIRKKVLGY